MGDRDPAVPRRRTRPSPERLSLADPTETEGILTAAGFADVSFTDVHEPVYYGPDSATAFDNVFRLLKFQDQVAGLDPATAAQVRTRLRNTLDAHATDRGVYFDSRAWLIAARRAPAPRSAPSPH